MFNLLISKGARNEPHTRGRSRRSPLLETQINYDFTIQKHGSTLCGFLHLLTQPPRSSGW